MTLSKTNKNVILGGFTTCCIILIFLVPRIVQDPAYHHFADSRKILGIANFYNVVTNLPFLILGLLGLYMFLKKYKLAFSPTSILTLFIGVIGIGLGSAYYHFNPSNTTLVWDRIPMTITFMSFFSIVLGRYVNPRLGSLILLPLLVLGIVSVWSWYRGELAGTGDLRLYALVQFYPMIAIPLIIFMYHTSKTVGVKVVGIIIVYAIAKIFEHQDAALFASGEIISGHSMKHIFAAGSVYLILLLVNESSHDSI